MSNPRDELDELIDEITVDCYGEDEQLCGFASAMEEALTEPVAATIVGAPVELVAIDDSGDPRRGLVARCRRDGTAYAVCALDVEGVTEPRLARLLAAYRRWSGLG